MEQTIANRLKELEALFFLKQANPQPYANYVEVNGLLFISGKGPSGKPKGKIVFDHGRLRIRQAGWHRNSCRFGEAVAESLDRVQRVVKLQGFVNAVPEFEEHHKVLNGCSDLMLDVFGDRGDPCEIRVWRRFCPRSAADHRGFHFPD